MSKITDLPVLTENDIAITDMVPILDVDANTTKQVPVQTLRGLTLNANPSANIKDLCTSDYTIQAATARMIAGSVAQVYIALNGGSSGIGYSTTANYFTLPSEYFGTLIRPMTVYARSEQAPTSAYLLATPHCFTPYGLKMITTVPNTDVQTLHGLPSWAVTNGKFKSLVFDFFAVVKPNVVLPYATA